MDSGTESRSPSQVDVSKKDPQIHITQLLYDIHKSINDFLKGDVFTFIPNIISTFKQISDIIPKEKTAEELSDPGPNVEGVDPDDKYVIFGKKYKFLLNLLNSYIRSTPTLLGTDAKEILSIIDIILLTEIAASSINVSIITTSTEYFPVGTNSESATGESSPPLNSNTKLDNSRFDNSRWPIIHENFIKSLTSVQQWKDSENKDDAYLKSRLSAIAYSISFIKNTHEINTKKKR